jgi:hypothetical protein
VVIVRNNYLATDKCYWLEQEEREKNVITGNDELNPIRRGENFKLVIYVDKEVYFVTINEKPFCTFKHRMPIEEIKKIRIFGQVQVLSVFQTTAKEQDEKKFFNPIKTEIKWEKPDD